jgi:hypothetical protein
MAIGPKDRHPRIGSPPLQFVRFKPDLLRAGVETHTIEGVPVKIFNAAKTVVDLFRYRQRQGMRYRHSTGLNLAIEGLREALRTRKATPAGKTSNSSDLLGPTIRNRAPKCHSRHPYQASIIPTAIVVGCRRRSRDRLTDFSMAPMQMVSGLWMTHEPSHNRSCGQTRGQISGMLLVRREISAASRNFPSAASAIHSGMRFPSGQPSTQAGEAHCTQRLACSRIVASSNKE